MRVSFTMSVFQFVVPATGGGNRSYTEELRGRSTLNKNIVIDCFTQVSEANSNQAERRASESENMESILFVLKCAILLKYHMWLWNAWLETDMDD